MNANVPAPEVGAPPDPSAEDIEGLDATPSSWGDYPLDELLIRNENRTIYDVIRRIGQGKVVMDPDFQRDFIWPEDKQSKLIESVVMRIPLPVFYLAEDDAGRVIVVDGLQRLSTFARFVSGKLKLQLPDRAELQGKTFECLEPKLQNRIEDCNLTFYIIDSKVPERARLDIFERVNGGVPLSRQQMRNSLYMGAATRFLKEEAQTSIFLKATGNSLSSRNMRDREFVNRFCAFSVLSIEDYRSNEMDEYLAACLRQMNDMDTLQLRGLSKRLRNSMTNNFLLFGRQTFRKHKPEQERRGVLNASLWDVMSTGLACYTEDQVRTSATQLRAAFYELLGDEDFNTAITYGPNDARRVRLRFQKATRMLKETLGADAD